MQTHGEVANQVNYTPYYNTLKSSSRIQELNPTQTQFIPIDCPSPATYTIQHHSSFPDNREKEKKIEK